MGPAPRAAEPGGRADAQGGGLLGIGGRHRGRRAAAKRSREPHSARAPYHADRTADAHLCQVRDPGQGCFCASIHTLSRRGVACAVTKPSALLRLLAFGRGRTPRKGAGGKIGAALSKQVARVSALLGGGKSGEDGGGSSHHSRSSKGGSKRREGAGD